MTDQLRQRAQEIADEHGNDACSVALRLVARENEIRRIKQDWANEIEAAKEAKRKLEIAEQIVLGDLNKIKAEAVRGAVDYADEFADDSKDWARLINQYANKLEQNND